MSPFSAFFRQYRAGVAVTFPPTSTKGLGVSRVGTLHKTRQSIVRVVAVQILCVEHLRCLKGTRSVTYIPVACKELIPSSFSERGQASRCPPEP